MDDDGVIGSLGLIDDLGHPDPSFLDRMYEVVAAEVGFDNLTGPRLGRDIRAVPRAQVRPGRSLRGRSPAGRGWTALVAAALIVVAALGLASSFLGGFPVRPPNGVTSASPTPTPSLRSPAVRPSVAPSTSPSVPDPFRIARAYTFESLGLATPLGMAAGRDGLLYVLDTAPSVTVIDPTDGHVVRTWGRKGSGPGQFNLSRAGQNPGRGDIAVAPNGRVIVADAGNQRVQIFRPDGAFLSEFGDPGVNAGQFSSLDDIAVGPDGSIFVIDLDVNRLSRFSPNGTFLWRSPDPTTDRRIAGPIHGIAVRPDGSVVANCEGCTGFLTFDGATGRLSGVIPAPDVGGDGGRLTIDRSGNLFVELILQQATLVLDPSGRLIAALPWTSGMQRMQISNSVAWGDVFYKAPVPVGVGRAYTFNRLGLVVLDVVLPSR
jgi:DNA-binding beta-propeller fold protein YncE